MWQQNKRERFPLNFLLSPANSLFIVNYYLQSAGLSISWNLSLTASLVRTIVPINVLILMFSRSSRAGVLPGAVVSFHQS